MKLRTGMKRLLSTLALCLVGVLSFAQTTGSFKGKIIEQSTKQPVIGASVFIDNTQFGTATDSIGVFAINDIPVGSYSVTISSIGFQTKNISEIIITFNKTYYSEIELLEDATTLEGVTINSFKGDTNPLTPVSSFSYSREEIFRNPGTSKLHRMKENIAAATITLSDKELNEINTALANIKIVGERYPPQIQKVIGK